MKTPFEFKQVQDIRLSQMPYYTWFKPVTYDSIDSVIFIKNTCCAIYNANYRTFYERKELKLDS
jgi:hypothetical protein